VGKEIVVPITLPTFVGTIRGTQGEFVFPNRRHLRLQRREGSPLCLLQRNVASPGSTIRLLFDRPELDGTTWTIHLFCLG